VFLPNATSFVLVGIWNPAILNPDWLARYIFKAAPDAEIPVEMLVPASPGQPIQFSLQGIRFIPSRDRLRLSCLGDANDEELAQIQEVTRSILELLPHTPVRAVGQNFEFLDEQPNPDHLKVFDCMGDVARTSDFPVETVGNETRTSLQFENRLLNLTRSFREGKLQVKFNFHSQVASATAAAEQLGQANLFSQNLAWSKRIIRNLYGVEL
jgi:hypothetical protein